MGWLLWRSRRRVTIYPSNHYLRSLSQPYLGIRRVQGLTAPWLEHSYLAVPSSPTFVSKDNSCAPRRSSSANGSIVTLFYPRLLEHTSNKHRQGRRCSQECNNSCSPNARRFGISDHDARSRVWYEKKFARLWDGKSKPEADVPELRLRVYPCKVHHLPVVVALPLDECFIVQLSKDTHCNDGDCKSFYTHV